MSDVNTIAVYTHLLLQRQRAQKEAGARLRAMVQQAKSAGVHWSDVQAALKEYEMTDDARRERAERQASVLSALGVPVQLEMFDAYVPRDNDDDAKARRRGWYAAICGAPAQPPAEPGTREGQAWLAGWHEFHEVLHAFMHDGELPSDLPAENAEPPAQ